ncbi:MAG TPA: GAF and ANTAR domain-containing protein [Acidimicrobiales bacterium]|nr:GAF and ANTAR domain-containing protein [Acidimicrobiales bacterium]
MAGAVALSNLRPGYVNRVHVEDGAVQNTLGQFAQRNLARLDLRAACEVVVGALPGLFGADGSGILLVDDTHVLRYVASTDAGAQLLEAVQESSGRGPCVEALVEDRAVTVSDVLEDERWPDLGRQLAPNGVRAVLGVPIRVGGVPVGSLNVYTGDRRAWNERDLSALSTMEVFIERLLTSAVFSERQEKLIEQLQRALEARVTVERAVGIIMAVEDVDAADAFERIRRTARTARRSVRDVASEVIERRALE